MTWLNWGCGTHRAPEPWVNVDLVDNGEVDPDLIIAPGYPTHFEAASVEKIYAGHVLEHVPWSEVPDLIAEFVRILEPGGELLVVGPDVFRAIERYRAGLEPWDIILAVLEGSHNFGFGTLEQWPGARHHWNCDEGRVLGLLATSELFATIEAIPPPDRVIQTGAMPPWPVVGWAAWQFAVRATKP